MDVCRFDGTVRAGLRCAGVRAGRKTSSRRECTLRVLWTEGRTDVSVRTLHCTVGMNRLESARVATVSVSGSTVTISGGGGTRRGFVPVGC